jgi:hypothetical protein
LFNNIKKEDCSDDEETVEIVNSNRFAALESSDEESEDEKRGDDFSKSMGIF